MSSGDQCVFKFLYILDIFLVIINIQCVHLFPGDNKISILAEEMHVCSFRDAVKKNKYENSENVPIRGRGGSRSSLKIYYFI